MRQAKPLLAALFVGIVFTAMFWFLLASSLPSHAAPAPAAPAPTGAASVTPVPAAQTTDGLAVTTAFSAAVTFGPIQIVTGAATISDSTNLAQDLAHALALAMDIDSSEIESATLMCNGGVCTDPAAVAVMGLAPGTWYPTRGRTFALLSTGTVRELPSTAAYQALDPAQAMEDPAPEVLYGMKNGEYGDLVRLHLGLRAPLTATCLALDFTFYTVDLPYTATESLTAGAAVPAGDIFTAQVGAADLRVENGTVVAPNNIAFNARSEVVASSTMSPSEIYASLRGPVSSNVPGVFPLLQMRQAITGGEPVDLYLSIQDRGDAYADSAVALDNFAWLADTAPADCQPKPGRSGDRDGDGLPDGWEVYGTFQPDGLGKLQHLDLKSMGADPGVKDVFVEIDAMQPLTPGGFDPRPRPAAIAQIVAAFARAPVDRVDSAGSNEPATYKGIHLHVDYGKDAPLDWVDAPGGETPHWGDAGRGDILSTGTQEDLCGPECASSLDWLWNTLDDIKRDNFAAARAPVFHYALFAHRLADCKASDMAYSRLFCGTNTEISGISKNLLSTVDGASDFIVSIGDATWTHAYSTPVTPQAGTFMHELGHNLGLNHYGTIESQDPLHIMDKPNHLSVMNYLYQTDGLVVSDNDFMFDYSRYNMATLNEKKLRESQGIKMAASGINITYTLGVRYRCQSTDLRVETDAHQVDWNCDSVIQRGPVDANISGDIYTNEDGDDFRVYSPLAAIDEWDQLVFTGGMLNRQRSMLYPFVAVRTPAPPNGDQASELAATAAGMIQGPRLLVLPEPVTIPAASRLIQEEHKARKDLSPPPATSTPTP
ncbi:MAG: hypothetical protein U0X20_15745 [Caldilineaceae bacterium]